MPEANPALLVSPIVTPRPVTGHRRQVQAIHPSFGALNLLTTDTNWGDNPQPNYVLYALTPPAGPKQRTIHSTGINEITWSISGELSNSSMFLTSLLNSVNRGVHFNSIYINQGFNNNYLFENINGYSLPWSNFTLTGGQNNPVTFTLEGKSTFPPSVFGAPLSTIYPDIPVPSWFTGNDFVLSWSISHSVNLVPKWANNASPYPVYYRPGASEYTIQVTTAVAMEPYSLIRFGVGYFSLIEAVVTSRNRLMGDRGSPPTYQVTVSNARVSSQEAFLPSVNISILSGPLTSGFS